MPLLFLSLRYWRTLNFESFLIELKLLIKFIKFTPFTTGFSVLEHFVLSVYFSTEFEIPLKSPQIPVYTNFSLHTTTVRIIIIPVECTNYLEFFLPNIFWFVMCCTLSLVCAMFVWWIVYIIDHCNAFKWIFMKILIELWGNKSDHCELYSCLIKSIKCKVKKKQNREFKCYAYSLLSYCVFLFIVILCVLLFCRN